jgi:hypothetical protein
MSIDMALSFGIKCIAASTAQSFDWSIVQYYMSTHQDEGIRIKTLVQLIIDSLMPPSFVGILIKSIS